MKKIVISITLVFLSVVAFFVYQIWPVKFAIKADDLKNSDRSYYLVKWTRATASTWMIIGDQTGEYSEAQYVVLQGNVPDIVSNYDIAIGQNIYVCYGEYLGERENLDTGETIGEYQITDWDILYPVRRNSVFPFWPKSYLSQMDMNGR